MGKDLDRISRSVERSDFSSDWESVHPYQRKNQNKNQTSARKITLACAKNLHHTGSLRSVA